jgi:hypothetical protein
MTFKNERYKGAPEGQYKIKVYGIYAERENRSDKLIIRPEAHPTKGAYLVVHCQSGENVLSDAALNAALVEKQQEEIERLQRFVEAVYGDGSSKLQAVEAELAALKAKYTPRPMSECTFERSILFGHSEVALAHYVKGSDSPLDPEEGWYTLLGQKITFKPEKWLPADTFKGGGDE